MDLDSDLSSSRYAIRECMRLPRVDGASNLVHPAVSPFAFGGELPPVIATFRGSCSWTVALVWVSSCCADQGDKFKQSRLMISRNLEPNLLFTFDSYRPSQSTWPMGWRCQYHRSRFLTTRLTALKRPSQSLWVSVLHF